MPDEKLCKNGCTTKIRCRDMCRRCYELWRTTATEDQKAWHRTDYPSDDVLVEWFKELVGVARVAKRLGISRESLRDYLNRRPELLARCKEYWTLPPEVVEQRAKDAARRWRRNNREKRREANRRWAANRSSEDVRKWNVYNAERRKAQRGPRLSVEEALLENEYEKIVLRDPCVYCGKPSGTLDHIEPINLGGEEGWENMAPACQSCNSSKRDKGLLQFLLWKLDREVI